MTSPMNCDTVRDLFYEFRQGRVEAEQELLFRAHLRQCPSCRDFVEKLDIMLDEALIWAPAEEPGLDRERIYAAVVEDLAIIPLSQRRRGREEQVQEKQTLSENEDIWADWEEPSPRQPLIPILLGAAAVLLLALSWPLFFAPRFQDNLSLEGDLQVTAEPSPLPSHSERLAIAENLRVFPAEEARWSLSAGDEGWEVDVQAGELVIEFVPKKGESLHFSLPAGKGRVVGTVFYVDGDRSEVGVLTGGVEIEDLQGQRRLIRDREAWREGKLVEIEPTRWERMEELVDPEEHQILLSSAQALPPSQLEDTEEPALPKRAPLRAEERPRHAPPAEQPAAQTPGPQREESSRPGPTRLRIQAERALRDRNFRAAAAHYEELLELLPPADRAAGSIRLDLARIYHRHLGDLENTARHLRFFVQTWPDDAVTPQALAELCRLVEDPAQEPHCRRR